MHRRSVRVQCADLQPAEIERKPGRPDDRGDAGIAQVQPQDRGGDARWLRFHDAASPRCLDCMSWGYPFCPAGHQASSLGWNRTRRVWRNISTPLCCANIAPAVACQPVEGSTDPDGCWHTEACHPIQHIASNHCFDLLTGQSPGEGSPSNDGFVSIHCSLNEASPVVTRMTLPAHATMPFDGCNMLIALRRPAAPEPLSPAVE